MNVSIPKDASDDSDDVPSEEDTSESFHNEEEDSETAALVTTDQLANLKADTFSFLVCSKILSQPFLLGISVFIFQITIFCFLAGDLLNPSSENNPLGIPEHVETNVRVTQFLAIIIAVLTQADLRTSLEQVSEGYSKERIGKEFGEATRGKWWFATVCRFWHGALGLVVTFLLIVTADNVFDLLLNFTAMEFVSKLDDAAFFLAGMGYFGSKNADKCEEIEETTYPQAANEKKRRRILHVLLLFVVFSGMLAGWGFIIYQQMSNKYLCEHFVVFSSQTELIEAGHYKLSRGRNDERVQYIQQNGSEEFEPGFRFGYCEKETSWTYYSGEAECDNFTAKSAETTTFDIRTTLSSPWVSDNQVQLAPIQFICVDVRLPTALGDLVGLRSLDLSFNRQLTGPIPSELGLLTDLTYLALDRNALTGSIPSELGSLTELTHLFLDYNQLTGSIPSQLLQLTNVNVFLSHNSFTNCGEFQAQLRPLSPDDDPSFSDDDSFLLSGFVECWNPNCWKC